MNRLLAQDYEVVSRSPDPANIWLGSPSLTVLPSDLENVFLLDEIGQAFDAVSCRDVTKAVVRLA
jgi:hypothetical protein